jgi:hypothetical protein
LENIEHLRKSAQLDPPRSGEKTTLRTDGATHIEADPEDAVRAYPEEIPLSGAPSSGT